MMTARYKGVKMRRLVSGDDVYEKAKSKEPIYIDKNTLVTPYARDLARDLGVKIECCSKQSEIKNEKNENMKDSDPSEPILSEDEIYNLLKEAIDCGYLDPKELGEML